MFLILGLDISFTQKFHSFVEITAVCHGVSILLYSKEKAWKSDIKLFVKNITKYIVVSACKVLKVLLSPGNYQSNQNLAHRLGCKLKLSVLFVSIQKLTLKVVTRISICRNALEALYSYTTIILWTVKLLLGPEYFRPKCIKRDRSNST